MFVGAFAACSCFAACGRLGYMCLRGTMRSTVRKSFRDLINTTTYLMAKSTSPDTFDKITNAISTRTIIPVINMNDHHTIWNVLTSRTFILARELAQRFRNSRRSNASSLCYEAHKLTSHHSYGWRGQNSCGRNASCLCYGCTDYDPTDLKWYIHSACTRYRSNNDYRETPAAANGTSVSCFLQSK